MTWFIFNADTSYCTSSDEKFDDSFVEKIIDREGRVAFQVELSDEQIDSYESDEFTMLHYNKDTGKAFVPDNVYSFGSIRHKKKLHEYLSIYSHLNKEDQPDDFDTIQLVASEVLGNEAVAVYFEDNILTQAEQQAMKDMLGL